MTTLVTGGTGTLGRLVVPMLQAAGVDVRVLTREPKEPGQVAGDLATGEGVAEAMAGVTTVVHLAGSAKGDDVKARNLVAAADGVRHIVYISVVGADRVPVRSGVDRAMFGYYAAKYAAEQVIAESGVPYTTLRATQFHELMRYTAKALAKLPVLPAPKASCQPIAAVEVAERLVELALGKPAGLVAELGGPRIYSMKEMFRGYLTATGKRRPVLRVGAPGGAAKAMKAGANLTPEHAVGKQTWEDFLAES